LTLDPLHANTDPNAPCKDDGATVPTLAAHDVLGANTVSVASGNAQAQTGITNSLGPVWQQAPAAVGQIDNSDINLGNGALHITAKAVRSYVAGQCQGNTPVLFSPPGPEGGEVVDLRINGTSILGEGQPDMVLTQIFDALSPLAPIIKVTLNKQYRTTDPVTGDQVLRREGVRIELLTAPGASPLITVVLGSATVDTHGLVCATPTGVNPPGTGGNPLVNPPALVSGSNQPGSNGGGTSNGGGGSVTYITSTGAVVTQAASGAPNNGTNASECVHLRLFWDLENHRPVIPATHGPTALIGRAGVRHVIRGVIRNCAGKPIVAGKLDVVNIVHGQRRLLKTGLRSRNGGKLTMITPNNLTTRTIEFAYRPFVNESLVASRFQLKLTVRRH
jgi:hypothetical protein